MKLKKEKRLEKEKERRDDKPSMQYVERNNVQFVGFNELHPDDQKRIKEIVYAHYIDLERELKRINSLRLNFKVYEKGGRKKYSVQLLIDAHTKPITVNKMYSPVQWDPVASVHLMLDKAIKEVVHKFKTDGGWKKDHEKTRRNFKHFV